ncbi:hypothetical protein E2C01_043884 [Portunus trituberculatus]|uniref:Uncharacterized protein n=1 Tax=Portunus trituberculatus TaxID=210409 RepID=A0A5B7FU29_PORTR|nr:hypothetical protein [Portunus trituberculatus]
MGGHEPGNMPPRAASHHDNAYRVLDREGDVAGGTLWWKGVDDVREHMCGEGAAHSEATFTRLVRRLEEAHSPRMGKEVQLRWRNIRGAFKKVCKKFKASCES